ncbi:MAG TPA: anthranilate phosphoribosyltransferase, partial [Phormidium sp.]
MSTADASLSKNTVVTDSTNSGNWSNLLQQLLDKQSLSSSQAADLMQGWLNDEIEPVLS